MLSGMSSAFISETILDVRHWTDAYFSFIPIAATAIASPRAAI